MSAAVRGRGVARAARRRGRRSGPAPAFSRCSRTSRRARPGRARIGRARLPAQDIALAQAPGLAFPATTLSK
ncbi:hypothetical protein AB5I41_09290 [Sphingomonas sp. MMS24-JH45]